jgi:aminobenzoyl-glutamate utilization protein A
LLAAATAVLNVHALTRFPGADTRVNVGKLVSGTSSNIIPADAVMLLETRADDQRTNAELERRVRNVLAGAAAIQEVAVAVERIGAASAVSCSVPAIEEVMGAAQDVPGLTVIDSHYVGVSDDASALIRAVQSAGGEATYCVVGATLFGAHHTPDFDLDEAALPLAVAVLERIVQRQELQLHS